MNNALQVARTLFLRLRFIIVFIVIGIVVGNWAWIQNVVDRLTRPATVDEKIAGDVEWYCPMHPSVVRGDNREKCPICGMPLSKRKKGEAAALPDGVLHRLQLTPFRIQQAGVATEEIGYRPLGREIRTVGTMQWDERRYSTISARVSGRADELYVDYTGVRIRKGDPVYRLYSPDLVSTQEEYLLALKSLEESRSVGGETLQRSKRLADATRERLRLWGISDEQIAELEKSKKAQTHLTIVSPVSGIVIKKDVLAGHQIAMGDDAYTLVDDSVMWMQAEVFERDLPLVKIGQRVDITPETGSPLEGRVVFIAPTVDPDTRTTKVRVEVPNPSGTLKAGMYVTALLRVPLGGEGEVYFGCCDACPEVRSDRPGKCPKCAMELVLKGGALVEKEKPAPGPEAKERKIYVCEVHPEEVFDKPGVCTKEGCNNMALEPRTVAAGSKVVYVCPAHPDVVSDKPGVCPKDQKKLQFQIRSETSRTADSWVCVAHPNHPGDAAQKCPECGIAMKHVQRLELLSVPISAVIDTGLRKVVFLERGHGTFDAVEIEVGPRAGEYYPVTKGLAAGDRVVTQGAFLLDAETRLNPAAGAAYFGAAGSSGQEKKK
jgi:multidrug efflux pump subunit AcrA (membrane-fusion protein)